MGSPSPYTGQVWDPWINRVTRARWTDTETTGERRDQAGRAKERLGLAPRVLVDLGGDPAWSDLGRAPSAAFVADAEGRIVVRQVWVDPPAIREILVRLLTSDPESRSRHAHDRPGETRFTNVHPHYHQYGSTTKPHE